MIGPVVRTVRSVPAGITIGGGVGVGVGGATGGVSLAADSVGGAGLYHAFVFGVEDDAAVGGLLWAGVCDAAVSGEGEEAAVGWDEAAFCDSLDLLLLQPTASNRKMHSSGIKKTFARMTVSDFTAYL